MGDAKNPLEMVIMWLESVRENKFTGNIGYLILTWCPGYDKAGIKGRFKTDYAQKLIDYLASINDRDKVVGMCLFMDRAVSFLVRDFDDADKMLDRMLRADELSKHVEDADDKDFWQRTKDGEPISFQEKKELKESWDHFRTSCLSFDALSSYWP